MNLTGNSTEDPPGKGFRCSTLRQHREALSHNPNAYIYDLPRVRLTVINQLRKCGYSKVSLKRCPELIAKFVELIFSTQENLPFFHVNGPLPYCWNSPKDWDKDYIRYEWGHLLSRNQSVSPDEIENLCLQSARCNKHIQTSMDINEVLIWLDGSAVANRIRDVLKKRETLFKSEEWAKLLNDFNKFQ